MEDINCWQENFVTCEYSERLLTKLTKMNKQVIQPVDITKITKAICYAKKYHGEQKRCSGEPYYSHPLEVAYMVADYFFKTDVITASILHDIVEDTEITIGMIVDIFGWRVAKIVDRVTCNKQDNSKSSVEELLVEAIKKDDKEVLYIKAIDRYHNTQTIASMPLNKQMQKLQQTIKEFLVLYEYLELPKSLSDLLKQRYAQIFPSRFNSLKKEHFASLGSSQLALLNFENEIFPDRIR